MLLEMFVLDAKAVAYGLAACGGIAATSVAVKNFHKLPHPSECGCIGALYRASGIHTHDPFDVIFDVLEAANNIENSKHYLEIVAGRHSYKTQVTRPNEGRLQFFEKLNVHVRQCDDFVVVNLYQKHMLKSVLCGSITFSVTEEILIEKPAKRRWYTLTLEGKSTSRVMLSIYKLSDTLAHQELSALAMQAILQFQQEGEMYADDESILNRLEDMTALEKLRFYSKVITGPLKRMNTFGKTWTEFYFKPLEISQGNWEWCYWDTVHDYEAGKECLGKIEFLSITLVLSDPSNQHNFYVKYQDKEGEYGVMLRKVDRNRNIWTDSLFEFIECVREVYLKNPQLRDIKKRAVTIPRTKELDTGYAKLSDIDTAHKQKGAECDKDTIAEPKIKALKQNIDDMAKHMYQQ